MKLDIEKALSHSIVMLTGDEDILRMRALNALLQASAGDDDFDLETFSGDSSSPPTWLGSCGTAPFLSPRRVALVRNLLRSEDEALLGKPALPETALLILVADTEGGDDAKQQRNAGRNRKWVKAAQEAGAFVYQPTVSASAFADLVRQDVADRGLKITQPAITALQEMVGGNLSTALEELEKVFLFVGDAGQIQDHDISAVVVPSREWNVFRLIDSVFTGKGGDALRQLKTMVGSNPQPAGPALAQVFPMLLRQLRLVWQARMFIEAKATLTSPPQTLRDSLPAHNSLLTQKEYPQKIAMRSAQSVTHRQLAVCFQIVYDAEARIKGLLPAFSAGDVLEQMVLEMTQAVANQSRAGAR